MLYFLVGFNDELLVHYVIKCVTHTQKNAFRALKLNAHAKRMTSIGVYVNCGCFVIFSEMKQYLFYI